MKTITLIISLILFNFAHAKSVSTDIDSYDNLGQKISPEVFKKNFQLRGQIYIMNPEGDILYSVGQEMRQWKFGTDKDLTSNWFFSSEGIEPISLKQVWSIDSDGRLKVSIKQYDNKDVKIDKKSNVAYKAKPIKEKSFTLKNFEPITWIAHSNNKYRVVVRVTPELVFDKKPVKIGRLPISVKEMIAADSKGFVWTQNTSFSGEYITLKTSRGTVHLSYVPFKGAKEIGIAEDNEMKIKLGDKHSLRFINSVQFLPSGMQAKVFGKVDLNEKTLPGSTHIQTSDEEKEFLSSIK